MRFDPMATAAAAATPGMVTEPVPAVTLRAYVLAAIASCVGVAEQSETIELRFLREHLKAVAGGGTHWLVMLADCLKQPAASDRQLIELSETLGLTLLETLAVALAAAVEDDMMV